MVVTISKGNSSNVTVASEVEVAPAIAVFAMHWRPTGRDQEHNNEICKEGFVHLIGGDLQTSDSVTLLPD